MVVLDRAAEDSTAEARTVSRSDRGKLTFAAAELVEEVRLTFSAAELVEEVNGGWTVRDLATGIFGAGQDLNAARADFDAALTEHLDVLERQPSLSEELEAQLAYLRRRLN